MLLSVPEASTPKVVLAALAFASSTRLAPKVDIVVLLGTVNDFIPSKSVTSLSINAPAAVTFVASVTSAPDSTLNADKTSATVNPSTSVPSILRKSLSATASLAVKTFPSLIPFVKPFTNARFVTSESINAPALVTFEVSVTSALASIASNLFLSVVVKLLSDCVATTKSILPSVSS